MRIVVCITYGVNQGNLLYLDAMKEYLMQKRVRYRSSSVTIARFLGLSFIGALIFTAVVALRHMLETPMRLVNPLPGESHYYKWKRGYIFYKVLGAPEAPPLLLLHSPELAASAYEMRKILEPLAQHYRVYAPDLIGFGFSDRPAIDYSAETYMTLCRDFLTDVVKQPATLVASRISCNYAVGTAATSPDLCERLVLLSPVALERMQVRASLLPALDTEIPFRNVWQQLLQTAPAKWLLFPMLSTRFALRSVLAKQHGLISDADLDYYYAASHQIGAQHASMALLAGKLERDVSQQLAMLQQSTLVIWGDRGLNDARHIASQQDLSWMKSHTRLALLPDTGLAVHEERPETVITTILSWSEEERKAAAPERPITVEAYCAKCKTKRGMLNATEVTAKNGRMAVRGTCEVCGSNLHRFGRIAQQSEV
jgi:pimeloyl-ACP methyl ester carboxylesterase